jgi:hypothetical protein
MRRGFAAAFVIALVAGVGIETTEGAAKLTLRSTAFANLGAIPAQHACGRASGGQSAGGGVSPPLSWTAPPRGTVELALHVFDLDAGGFTHWTTWGISPRARALARAKAGPRQGRTDAGTNGWFGPCPPPGGPHRYAFALYALRAKLTLRAGATPAQFRAALRGKVLAQARLVGTFEAVPPATPFVLTSPAFAAGATIPPVFSCTGPSPALAWTAPPAGTASVALLVDDADAGNFTHWITWGISAQARALGQGQAGPVQGQNDATGQAGWFGPCPPPGDPPHRYVFHLYALKVQLSLAAGATRAQFLAAISGQVLQEARLIGLFGR